MSLKPLSPSVRTHTPSELSLFPLATGPSMRRASHLGGVAQMGVHLDGRRMNQESTVTSSGIAPGLPRKSQALLGFPEMQ